MNRHACYPLAAVLCMLLVAKAAAQAPEKRPTDLGSPGEEHRMLDALAGEWDVTVRFPGPAGPIEGRATMSAGWVMDGRFLRQEYASTFAGKPLSIVRYSGFDRHKARFVEVQFESTHTDVMHNEGSASPDGKSITCLGTHVDAAAGRQVTVRSVTSIIHRDAFSLELLYEGDSPKVITLTHKRKIR